MMNPSFMVFGASVPGLRHTRNQVPCEDACVHAVFPDCSIVAVADGLSSAGNGKAGAETGTRACVDAASALTCKDGMNPGDIIREAMSAGRSAIQALAERENAPLASYGTTMLLAYVSHAGVWCGHIGDGAAVCVRGDDVSILSAPGSSEYANETAVLTASDWETYLRVSSGSPGTLLLATDGCQGAVIRRENGKYSPYLPFVLPLVHSLYRFVDEERDVAAAIRDLLSSERMQALSSDDMTLAVVLSLPGESVS
ncbi:MAG: protein phosphatase 2C domain-containing protein [Methanospirillum sp.]|nr:protein phosphatase 2C domain-containing protein [Methanospirillum sp.]